MTEQKTAAIRLLAAKVRTTLPATVASSEDEPAQDQNKATLG
jgi:hypothetical protein